MMKKITLFIFILTFYVSNAQNTVTVDVSATWLGYMSIFDNPEDPTPDCGGGYCFGQAWGVPDLKTTIGPSAITLQPNYNTYNASDPYWSNGAIGNKILVATTYTELGASFNGLDLTFTGNVVSNNLDPAYTAQFFIKALDPNADYADVFAGSKIISLPASGVFSVSATGAELASGLIVQYGFVITGLNANPVDETANGSVVVEGVTLATKNFEIAGLNVYPNPAQDSWTVKTKNIKMSSIEVFDMLGKQVISLKPETTEATINASQLKSGLYFAKINTADGSTSLKLVRE